MILNTEMYSRCWKDNCIKQALPMSFPSFLVLVSTAPQNSFLLNLVCGAEHFSKFSDKLPGMKEERDE